MNQHQIPGLRTIIFLPLAILVTLLFVTRVRPVLAQSTPAKFDAVDVFINAKMKALGIPGAALVIVEGDQIVHLKAFGVIDDDHCPSASKYKQWYSPICWTGANREL